MRSIYQMRGHVRANRQRDGLHPSHPFCVWWCVWVSVRIWGCGWKLTAERVEVEVRRVSEVELGGGCCIVEGAPADCVLDSLTPRPLFPRALAVARCGLWRNVPSRPGAGRRYLRFWPCVICAWQLPATCLHFASSFRPKFPSILPLHPPSGQASSAHLPITTLTRPSHSPTSNHQQPPTLPPRPTIFLSPILTTAAALLPLTTYYTRITKRFPYDHSSAAFFSPPQAK